MRLPSGLRVRGRRLTDSVSPADFALVLAPGPPPPWRYRRVRWPDYWLPVSTADAADALLLAYRLTSEGARVEVMCKGGKGRTGTALAGLAILDGLDPRAAVAWVRDHYHPGAVEAPWQRWWLYRLRWYLLRSGLRSLST
jgi:hypothetical protein